MVIVQIVLYETMRYNWPIILLAEAEIFYVTI